MHLQFFSIDGCEGSGVELLGQDKQSKGAGVAYKDI